MNNNIQKLKITGGMLEILELLSKFPEKEFTVEKLLSLTRRENKKKNYATLYRKVDALVKQNFLIKTMYGMASQIRLNLNDNTILLLALVESYRRGNFLKNVKGSTRNSLERMIEYIGNIIELKSVLIFGSYAKNTYRQDSDMDILVVYAQSSLKKSYKERIRDAAMSIFKTCELRGSPKINPIIVNTEEHEDMITNNENNVGKEALLNHIMLNGESAYWREIAKCFPRKK